MVIYSFKGLSYTANQFKETPVEDMTFNNAEGGIALVIDILLVGLELALESLCIGDSIQ